MAEILPEEYDRRFPGRRARAVDPRFNPGFYAQVGAHQDGELIKDIYAFLMKHGLSHEEAMGQARGVVTGRTRGTDPSSILPIGPVNMADLRERGVTRLPGGALVDMLRAIEAGSPEPVPQSRPPLRANDAERQAMAAAFGPPSVPPDARSAVVSSPRNARMAGQLLAALLAGAGGLAGAGLSWPSAAPEEALL